MSNEMPKLKIDRSGDVLINFGDFKRVYSSEAAFEIAVDLLYVSRLAMKLKGTK